MRNWSANLTGVCVGAEVTVGIDPETVRTSVSGTGWRSFGSEYSILFSGSILLVIYSFPPHVDASNGGCSCGHGHLDCEALCLNGLVWDKFHHVHVSL